MVYRVSQCTGVQGYRGVVHCDTHVSHVCYVCQSLFREESGWSLLLFVYDVETNGGCAHVDNPVELPELAGVWVLLTRPGGVGPVRSAYRDLAFSKRARVASMGAFVQSLHKISFGDVEHEITQRALMDVLINAHIHERET